eukprot:scaffold7432_cov107-Isochrysis_galbana.AAC.2
MTRAPQPSTANPCPWQPRLSPQPQDHVDVGSCCHGGRFAGVAFHVGVEMRLVVLAGRGADEGVREVASAIAQGAEDVRDRDGAVGAEQLAHARDPARLRAAVEATDGGH